MRSLYVGSVALACLFLNACACSNPSGNDAGSDGGVDAGPLPCQSTADCAAANLTDFVCDPSDKVCVPKCTSANDCTRVPEGVCELTDGTCRPRCNGSGGDYCTSPDAGFVNKVCNDDTGSCVNRCSQDDDCSAIKTGTRCDDATGKCTKDVHGCNVDTDCNSFVEFEDYCFNGGIQCRCVIEANDAGTTGVCHRRNRSCSECTTDAQCGNVPQFDPQGACLAISGDTSGKKYCLFQHSGPCACGYFDNGNGYCAPAQGRTCADPGCAADKDCPGGSVCNRQRCACEPRCRWDFATKQVAAPGCPPNQTCWVDNENLDPASIYYGAGRCKPPCTGDADCAFSATNPNGGAKLKCAGEQLAGGGMSEKRCRANGECMDDLECPVQPDTSIYFGYCDRGSFTCKLDCRTGNDPVTMKPYNDCRSPYGCKEETGMNKCILKTCVEQGGAAIACSIGEYCCGEDKNLTDAGDPCPPQNERDLSGCYRAPSAPFCKACRLNCAGGNCAFEPGYACDTVPGWLTSEPDSCTNGSKSPSCAAVNGQAMPNICTLYQQDMANQDLYYGYCEAATHNDLRRDMTGRTNAGKGCPATFGVRFDPIGDPPQAPGLGSNPKQSGNYCDSDADCRLGGATGGSCQPSSLVPRNMDGSLKNACVCTVGMANQCPNQADAGIFSFCRDGNPGETTFCVSNVVCNAPRPYLFGERDAGPLFGCGITPVPQ